MMKSFTFKLISFVVLAPLFAAPAYASNLYVVKDARGSVTITSSKPKPGVKYTLFKASKGNYAKYSVSPHRTTRWKPRVIRSDYDKLIARTAHTHALEPELVKAMVHAESAFKANARSPKGARGLMQLMPATAKRMGVRNIYHPRDNVEGGVKYFRWLLDRYKGNERLAIAAYNAGEGAVDRVGGIPPYRETQEYVRRVIALREMYRCDSAGRNNCS